MQGIYAFVTVISYLELVKEIGAFAKIDLLQWTSALPKTVKSAQNSSRKLTYYGPFFKKLIALSVLLTNSIVINSFGCLRNNLR